MSFTDWRLVLFVILAWLPWLAWGETIVLPTGYGEAFFQTANVRKFAADVGVATGGRIQIDVRSGGEHTSLDKIRERLESGQIVFGEFNLSAESATEPLFGLDALPFIVSSYNDAELLWKLSRAAIARAMLQRGMVLLYAVPWPPQGLYANRRINDIRDIRGLQFRTYNPASERLATLFATVPVSVALPDLRQALREKRLDILLTSASSGVDTQAWEYMNHYIDLRAWYPKNVVAVNARHWASLDEKDRQAILAVARRAEARGWQASREVDQLDMRRLAARGMKIEAASALLNAGFERIGEQLVREYLHRANSEALGILLEYNKQRWQQGQP